MWAFDGRRASGQVAALAARRWGRRSGALACVLATCLLAACGTLPAHVDAVRSFARVPADDGPLVRIARNSTPSADDSGVRLMPLGSYSLDTRIQLARRASDSIDLQYYVFESDRTGRSLMLALRDAALRGVRVRLLVDDLYTTHSDPLLRGLAAYPNVEVRLFNPFCCARSGNFVLRYLGSAFDFGRLNHRMHNKLFVVDGVMAVAGGRNITDEYFLRAADSNFVDVDAFLMGAVVRDLEAIFDRYWNSEIVYPIEAIGMVGAAGSKDAERRSAFDRTMASLPSSPPLDPPPYDVLGYGPISEDLDAGRVGLIWGRARAFADPPEKLFLMTAQIAYEMSVTSDVFMRVLTASRELVLMSPYLIPGERGMALFRHLKDAGVKVTVITNSLAATDVPLVYAGYARYREAMLEAGVDLYELSPTRTQNSKGLGMFGPSLGRLHAKTVVIDRRVVFIGSMNLDPRSATSTPSSASSSRARRSPRRCFASSTSASSTAPTEFAAMRRPARCNG